VKELKNWSNLSDLSTAVTTKHKLDKNPVATLAETPGFRMDTI
jgi:hypothetical protein